MCWAGSRPGRAASNPRGVGERTPAPSADWRRSRGCGYCASGGGRNDSRMVGAPSAGCGPRVVAQGHPACRQPGRAEQTTARPASARTCVKVRSTRRAGRRPAPKRAGRRQTGWRGAGDIYGSGTNPKHPAFSGRNQSGGRVERIMRRSRRSSQSHPIAIRVAGSRPNMLRTPWVPVRPIHAAVSDR